WPDLASLQTDREALDEAREMLGYMGHILAGGDRDWGTWEQARETLLERTTDISLDSWRAEATLVEGVYEIPALSVAMNVEGPWKIEKTRDGYYTLTESNSNQQLALRTGEQWLSVVNEIGAKAELAEAVAPALPREKTAGEFNMRKFAIEFVDQHSIRISPALTHMVLTATEAGLVQLPPDIAGENIGEAAVFSVSRLENQ
ncbi:MAG: hypothetical protein SPG61_02850, partial [Arcanobacterium sp.]|nr:hypothetical protein [Arcanobacterium sp.]